MAAVGGCDKGPLLLLGKTVPLADLLITFNAISGNSSIG